MRRLEPVDGISNILVRHNLISNIDLIALHKAFRQRDDISFEDFLIEEGVVDKSDLLQALSEYYKVPQCDVVGMFIDHFLVKLVPKDVLLEHLMIPYQREGDELWVAAEKPDDPHLPVVLGKYLSHNFNFTVGLGQDIRDAIREYYDESVTYQPNDISNQQMERSAQDVHEPAQLDERIPLIVEETVDDYESR